MLDETSEHSLAWLDEAVGSCLRQTTESVFVLARFGYPCLGEDERLLAPYWSDNFVREGVILSTALGLSVIFG